DFFVPKDAQAIALQEPGSNAPEEQDSEQKKVAPLRLKISIQKDAAAGVRKDSRFYINMAGIIGERYVEVTPGHLKEPPIKNGDEVAGVDPPRVDQLLSQSFNLFGKITE